LLQFKLQLVSPDEEAPMRRRKRWREHPTVHAFSAGKVRMPDKSSKESQLSITKKSLHLVKGGEQQTGYRKQFHI